MIVVRSLTFTLAEFTTAWFEQLDDMVCLKLHLSNSGSYTERRLQREKAE